MSVKLTDAEHRELKRRARSAGVKLADFIRQGCFRLTVVSRVTDEDRRLIREITAMHTNFNQAVKWLNTYKCQDAADRLLIVIDTMFDLLKKLRPNSNTTAL